MRSQDSIPWQASKNSKYISHSKQANKHLKTCRVIIQKPCVDYYHTTTTSTLREKSYTKMMDRNITLSKRKLNSRNMIQLLVLLNTRQVQNLVSNARKSTTVNISSDSLDHLMKGKIMNISNNLPRLCAL